MRTTAVIQAAISVLPSASRTTTQTQPDQANVVAKGLVLIVDVTTAGTGSITPKVQGKDANGVYYDILVGSAITTVSTNKLIVYPGAAVTANASANEPLPAVWRVIVTHNNANAITYSVGAQLVG
jgi:hypothetical protein